MVVTSKLTVEIPENNVSVGKFSMILKLGLTREAQGQVLFNRSHCQPEPTSGYHRADG